jgi:hypothetical protein
MGFDCWKKITGDAKLPSKACAAKSQVTVAEAGRKLQQRSRATQIFLKTPNNRLDR